MNNLSVVNLNYILYPIKIKLNFDLRNEPATYLIYLDA